MVCMLVAALGYRMLACPGCVPSSTGCGADRWTGYRHVSMVPVIGTLFVVAGGLLGFRRSPNGLPGDCRDASRHRRYVLVLASNLARRIILGWLIRELRHTVSDGTTMNLLSDTTGRARPGH